MTYQIEDQPHQASAIAAVTDLFEGALTSPIGGIVGQAPGADGHAGFRLDKGVLTDHLKAVTVRQDGVEPQDHLVLLEHEDLLAGDIRAFPNFSVEMETGTGKTYVYINTALQLAQTYGLRKFVILVHSVAIRAQAIKMFEITREHFTAKFPSLQYSCGVLGEGPALDDFLEPSSTVKFLVASVQAIDKPETGLIYQQAEQPQLWGDSGSGMTSIAAVNPVVIVDEPQNFKTDLRKKALATLNPLVVLRYSATHAEKFNLVHRLGPKAAAEQGLVKRVSVKGISAGDSGTAYLRVDKLRTKNKRLFAEVMIDIDTANGPKRSPDVLQNADDLYVKSQELDQYRGWVVDRFERGPDRVIFENGVTVKAGEEVGVNRLAIWQDQIRHTIRTHLQRQAQIDATGREVKVLSLFFVDRVADYWPVDGQPSPVLPDLFDRLYREEWTRADRDPADCPDPSTLRVHYFPSTKTGIHKDSAGSSAKAQEEQARAYEEIIEHKEKLLTTDNPRAFIFSHSALKEGWDNPNVFQIGFLRQSGSEVERRQQIGRGLRLPLEWTKDSSNDLTRVHDPAICRLTLIVDETFAEFRDGLNAEYAAAGGGNGPEPEDADNTISIRRREDKFLSPEFKELWSRIRYKARYRISIDASALPKAVASSEHLDEIKFLSRRNNIVQEAELKYDEAGKVVTTDTEVSENAGMAITIVGQRLPDLVRLVEDQLLAAKFPLQLTRPTVAAIVGAIPAPLQARAIDDPERWARIVAVATRTVAIEQMVDHIGYEREPEEDWWNADVIFLEIEKQNPTQPHGGSAPMNGVVAAPVGGTNLFDHVIYDSKVEREFAAQLENNQDHVKLFTKLPRRFRVRTPVGEYSPDWAIVYVKDGTEQLHLVRETKGTLNLDDLDWDEAMRIRFARKHFDVAPAGKVDYYFTTAAAGLRINGEWKDASDVS